MSETAIEHDDAKPIIELSVGPVAHGGHCVARHEGRVVFVRHTLPGERVRARLSEAEPDATFWRADAVEILEASPDRVPSVWPAAGPGGVGGGELAHVALPAQRRWKAAVLAEQLERLAGLGPEDLPDGPVEVESAPGDDERSGLGWRTRITLVAGADGRAGMSAFRSHDVLAIDDMPLATEQVLDFARAQGVFTRTWPVGTRLDVVAPANGEPPLLLADSRPVRAGKVDERPNARRTVTETVDVAASRLLGDAQRTYAYRINAAGFWQVHREAPAVLVGAVLDALATGLSLTGSAEGPLDAAASPDGAVSLDGATVADLYSGSGLFTVPLADAVGPHGRVVAVEGSHQAVRDARRALHDRPYVELHAGAVEHVLTWLRASAGERGGLGAADAVVLDPPRVGAGRHVVEQVAILEPRVIVYVACDPAALARDVALFAAHGYTLNGLRAFDLFPMTHHVEAVATLIR